MALQHPAVEAVERLANNEASAEFLGRRDRGELKYIIAEASGAFDASESDAYGETDGSLTKDEMVALALAFAGGEEE